MNAARPLRYRLLHRTAAAVMEAQRFAARHAVMLVHSFSPSRTWFEDYQAFVAVLGGQAAPGTVVHVGQRGGVDRYCGWATGALRR